MREIIKVGDMERFKEALDQAGVKTLKETIPLVYVADYNGLKVFLDESIPSDTVHIVDNKGKVLASYKI